MTNQEAIGILLSEQKCLERNDGTQCDRKCESCDLVMDVGIIREAYNMAISALQAQEIKQELKQEVKNSNKSSLTHKTLDTISRQAVAYLDLFTKTYCRDYSVTDDLVFRCKECEFEKHGGKCLVKCMARKLCPDYKEFGCMGDL